MGFPPKQTGKPMAPNKRSSESKSNFAKSKGSGTPLHITIAIDKDSWLRNYLDDLIDGLIKKWHKVHKVYQASNIKKGDLVFFLGFQEIVRPEVMRLNKHNLVIH